MGGYTVSVQMSGDVNQQHNRRDKDAVERANQRDLEKGVAPHIQTGGKYENWIDKKPMEALHEVMDAPLAEYNAGQKRKARRRTVEDVVARYEQLSKTPLVREIILEVGNVKHHPEESECKDILHRQLDVFGAENPNMLVIGAYYHADEPGSAPHLHVDFIPLHQKRARGVPIQIGMAGALEDLGYSNEAGFKTRADRKEGALAKWSYDLHERMHEIAKEKGCETVKGVTEKEEDRDIHEPTLDHKIKAKKKEIDELEEQQEELSKRNTDMGREYQVMQAEHERMQQKILSAEDKCRNLGGYVSYLQDKIMQLETAVDALVHDVNTTVQDKMQAKQALRETKKELASAKHELANLEDFLPKQDTPSNKKISKGVDAISKGVGSTAKMVVDAIDESMDDYER